MAVPKKKRTKSFNPNKVAQRYSNRMLNNVMVTFVGGGNGKSHIVNRHSKYVYSRISHQLEDDLLKRKHNWTVYCAILCRDNHCNNYTKAEELYFETPVLQSEIQDYLTDYHIDLLRQQNQQHVLGIAWIACPYNISMDEEFAYDIFDMFKGFDKKAKWQMDNVTSNATTP